MRSVLYLAAVGSLNYLTIGIRFNIAHAVVNLASLKSGSQDILQVYCNANYIGDEDRRQSTTAYAFFIGEAAAS